MKDKKFAILGACKVSIGIILDALYSQYGDQYKIHVQIIHNIPEKENQYADLEYKHPNISISEINYQEWQPKGDEDLLLSGMAPSTKEKIYQFFLQNFGIDKECYKSVIHKQSYISHGVNLQGAILVAAGVIIEQYVKLAPFVSIFTNSSIAHHTKIDEFSTVLLGNNIAGFCHIGKKVIVGMGSNIFNRVRIGDNSFIGGGSLVTQSIPANVTAYGSPAKVVKNHS